MLQLFPAAHRQHQHAEKCCEEDAVAHGGKRHDEYRKRTQRFEGLTGGLQNPALRTKRDDEADGHQNDGHDPEAATVQPGQQT